MFKHVRMNTFQWELKMICCFYYGKFTTVILTQTPEIKLIIMLIPICRHMLMLIVTIIGILVTIVIIRLMLKIIQILILSYC